MTQLARIEGHGVPSQTHSIDDIQRMAKNVAMAKLFPGIDNEHAAFTLMMLCEAEGLHPMNALRRYHIIEGRPSMRADAMQAEFQRQGGIVRWGRSDREICEATFIHATHAPEGVKITITFAEMHEAGVTQGKYGVKDVWKKYPASMLRARVISQGVRMVLPGVVVGIYTEEEVRDMVDQERHQVVDVEAAPQAPSGEKRETYREMVKRLVAKANRDMVAEGKSANVDLLASDLISVNQLEQYLHTWACKSQLRPEHESRKEMAAEARRAILANLYDDNPTGIAEQVSYLIEIAVDSIRNTIAEQSRGRAAEPANA